MSKTRNPRLRRPAESEPRDIGPPDSGRPPLHRCPTGREDAEVRVFTVAGTAGAGRDVVVQLYRRVGHDLAAPMGPTATVVRLSARYAPALAELILQAAAEATTAETGRAAR